MTTLRQELEAKINNLLETQDDKNWLIPEWYQIITDKIISYCEEVSDISLKFDIEINYYYSLLEFVYDSDDHDAFCQSPNDILSFDDVVARNFFIAVGDPHLFIIGVYLDESLR